MTSIFSKRLREARLKKGLSLEELARAVGTTKSTLSKYENSLREPKMLMAKKISDKLDVSFNWLIGYSDNTEGEFVPVEINDLFNTLTDNDKKEVIKYIKYLKFANESDKER